MTYSREALLGPKFTDSWSIARPWLNTTAKPTDVVLPPNGRLAPGSPETGDIWPALKGKSGMRRWGMGSSRSVGQRVVPLTRVEAGVQPPGVGGRPEEKGQGPQGQGGAQEPRLGSMSQGGRPGQGPSPSLRQWIRSDHSPEGWRSEASCNTH